MNQETKARIEKYIKDGIKTMELCLDNCKRGVPLRRDGKLIPPDQAVAEYEASLELYMNLLADYEAGNFETETMMLVRRIINEPKLVPDLNKALQPFTKIVNSGKISGLMQCFNVKPNGFYERDGKQYEATQMPVGTNLMTTIAWLGGVLKPVGIKLAHFIIANYSGSSVMQFTLQDFMHYAKLPDRDKAAELVKQEAGKLAGLQWIIDEQQKRRPGVGYFGLYGVYYANNIIKVTLTIEGEALMRAARGHCYFPMNLLQRNLARNPHSITLGTKLSYLKGMNWGKQNCDRYGALWLIKDTDIPLPEEVNNQQYKNLIITPFERDMNANKDIYSWKYIQGSGNNWKEFQNAVVEIIWNNHPQDLLDRAQVKPRPPKKAK